MPQRLILPVTAGDVQCMARNIACQAERSRLTGP